MTSIEGLCVQPEPAQLELSGVLRSGKPDVSEAVGVTIEAYRDLGFVPDVDQATESLTTNFTPLAELGYDGRLYVEPPAGISFNGLTTAADGRRAKGVDTLYHYPNLWTPGTEANSYTIDELYGNPAIEPQARLAVFNADRTTNVDPILHFLNMPYDDKYRDGASQTQLEALEALEQAFTGQHPEATMQALGHRATVMLVLMDRIRGVETINPKSADFVLNQGFVRIPNLGRKEVGGDSIVGNVDSYGSRLVLDGGNGRAYSGGGVGLSVGLNPA